MPLMTRRSLSALLTFCLVLTLSQAAGRGVAARQAREQGGDAGDPRRCLDKTDSDIDWNTSGDPPVVRLMFEYENICERPVRCKVTVQSGTLPTGAARGDYSRWEVVDMLTFKFSVAPHETRRLLTTLAWSRPAGTTPHLRSPSAELSRNPELMECSFADAPP
jgi:hypothetical protein